MIAAADSRRTTRRQSRIDRSLRETARRLSATEIAYVGHRSFARRGFSRWLATQRLEPRQEPIRSESPASVAFVAGLADAALLSPAEERYLFLQMNYLRYRAECQRRRIDPQAPDAFIVAEVQRLLAEAERLRNRIAEANVRLVVATAKKLSRSVDQMSEFIGEGMLPLLRAVELFDVHRGHRFSTYALWAVRNQIVRMLQRRSGELPLDEPEELAERESSADETDPVESSRLVAALRQTLTSRERQIIDRRFGLQGQPQRQSLAEIGRQVGLSKERVRQLVLLALDKMRQAACDASI